MSGPDPTQVLADIYSTSANILLLLEQAMGVQWEPSRRVSLAEEVGITSKGDHSDPTSVTALDETRLALRREVDQSAKLLLKTWYDMARQERRLLKALEHWNGEVPEK